MSNQPVTLPRKPSALLRLAIDDLEKVEADPRFKVDMAEWFTPYEDENVCRVCLAGAVMAQTLGGDPTKELFPASMFDDSDPDAARLAALDEFRAYRFAAGLREFGDIDRNRRIDIGETIRREVTGPVRYDDSPDTFREDMRRAADILEAEGF